MFISKPVKCQQQRGNDKRSGKRRKERTEEQRREEKKKRRKEKRKKQKRRVENRREEKEEKIDCVKERAYILQMFNHKNMFKNAMNFKMNFIVKLLL